MGGGTISLGTRRGQYGSGGGLVRCCPGRGEAVTKDGRVERKDSRPLCRHLHDQPRPVVESSSGVFIFHLEGCPVAMERYNSVWSQKV